MSAHFSNCFGDGKLSMVLFRCFSKLRYGSDWVSLALVSTFIMICTDFSARPFASGLGLTNPTSKCVCHLMAY